MAASFFALIPHLFLGNIFFAEAMWMGIGVILGAQAGAKFAAKTKSRPSDESKWAKQLTRETNALDKLLSNLKEYEGGGELESGTQDSKNKGGRKYQG